MNHSLRGMDAPDRAYDGKYIIICGAWVAHW